MSERPHSSRSDSEASSPDPQALLPDLYRRFVHLVLYARVGLGTWRAEDELDSFTVYLGEQALVRVNQEQEVWRTPVVQRSFARDETIEPTDLLTEAAPLASAHGRPFVKAQRHTTGWQVEFDFRMATARGAELLAAADEFLQTARWSLERGYLRAFVENGFHAAELLAKAELLAYPVVADEVEGSRKHTAVLSAYHLWANLGNTDGRFAGLLQELLTTRGTATYADGEFNCDGPVAQAQLEILLELRQHVQDILAGDKGRVFRVIATRDIQAGSLVTRADATIRPSKKRRIHRDS